MTNEELAAIQARVDAATPGPWYTVDPPWGNGTHIVAGSPDPHGHPIIADCAGEWYHDPTWLTGDAFADAAFIAKARTDIPALLAYIKELHTLLLVHPGFRCTITATQGEKGLFAQCKLEYGHDGPHKYEVINRDR